MRAVSCAAAFRAEQDWIEYKNLEDHFSINAPGQPKAEKITWKSEYDSMFPGMVYRWQDGANRYSVTVVDYSDSEAIYTANHHSEDFRRRRTGRSISWGPSSTPPRSTGCDRA